MGRWVVKNEYGDIFSGLSVLDFGVAVDCTRSEEDAKMFSSARVAKAVGDSIESWSTRIWFPVEVGADET
jgi:hypothetical protein